MKITAEGATDGGNIVLFWSANLPEDFDSIDDVDRGDLFVQLMESGEFVWFLAEGDGDFTVHIYIDEPLPETVRETCSDEDHYPCLNVNGDAWFGGMEYMYKYDRSFLDRHPGMCEKVVIPDGEYEAWVYRTDAGGPEGDAVIAANAGRCAVWAQSSSALMFFMFFPLSILWIIFMIGLPWSEFPWLAGLFILPLVLAYLITKTPWYRAYDRAYESYRADHPNFVVVLKSEPSATGNQAGAPSTCSAR